MDEAGTEVRILERQHRVRKRLSQDLPHPLPNPSSACFMRLRVGFFECQPRKSGGVIAATPMIFFAGNTSHTRTFSTRKVVRIVYPLDFQNGEL